MSELQGLQSRIDEFRRTGTRLVAISVDPVALNLEVARRHHLEFPILADPDGEAARAFGVLHPGAGPGGTDLARPATFVLEGGLVRWRDLTENFRVRPRPEQLLRVVNAP